MDTHKNQGKGPKSDLIEILKKLRAAPELEVTDDLSNFAEGLNMEEPAAGNMS